MSLDLISALNVRGESKAESAVGFQKVAFFSSGVASFFCYFATMFLLLYTFGGAVASKYAAMRQSDLAMKNAEIFDIEALIIEESKSAGSDLKAAAIAALSPLSGSGVKDIFADIDSASLQNEVADDREKIATNAKNNLLSDLVAKSKEAAKNAQNLSAIDIGISNPSEGEYDEWYAKIDKILQENWRDSSLVEQASAKVIVVIDKAGKFSYRILRASGVPAFDNALKSTLERLTNYPFPPFERGPQTSIEVTFKKR